MVFENASDVLPANLGPDEALRWPSTDDGFVLRRFDLNLLEAVRLEAMADAADVPPCGARFYESESIPEAYLAVFRGPDPDFVCELAEGVEHHRFYISNPAKRQLMLGSQRPAAIQLVAGTALWHNSLCMPESLWEESGRGLAPPAGRDQVVWLEVPGGVDFYPEALQAAAAAARGVFRGLSAAV